MILSFISHLRKLWLCNWTNFRNRGNFRPHRTYQSTRQTSRHQPKFPYKNLHFLQQKPTSNHSSIFTHPSLKKWRQVNAHTRKKRASGDGTSVIGFFIRTIWGVASVLLLFLIVEMSVSARVIMIERADFRPLLLPFIFSVCRLLIWLLSGLYVGFGLAASVSLGESEVAVAWPWRPFPQTSRFELQWTLFMVKRSYEGGKCSFMFCCFPLAVMWCFNHLIGVLFCYVLSDFFLLFHWSLINSYSCTNSVKWVLIHSRILINVLIFNDKKLNRLIFINTYLMYTLKISWLTI